MAKKNSSVKIVILAAVVLFMAGAPTLLYSVNRANIVKEDAVVYIPEGTTFDGLLDTLSADGGKIKNMGRFRRVARSVGLDKNIKKGRYMLKKGMSAKQVANMFLHGTQTPLNVTFNNIRTMDRLAGRISKQLEPDSLEFLRYLTSDTIAAEYGFTREEFPGMFIPNTYQMYWTTSPKGFLDRMKREYDTFWNEERLSKLERTGLTQKEVVTLASIVYEETRMSDEMPTVAGVYINRLRKGMYLQADPTVKFAVGDPALKRILYKHLEVDSPYNTYKNKGLPPGPVSMPSIKAIDAVLNYDEHDYIFFCAKPDFSGYHSFAKTYEQHQKNAKAYRQALDKAGIK